MPGVFDPDVAREIVEALAAVEAGQPGRRFVYTVGTRSDAPAVGTGEHSGLLRTYAADCVTVATDSGDLEIGWYEITSIRAEPD